MYTNLDIGAPTPGSIERRHTWPEFSAQILLDLAGVMFLGLDRRGRVRLVNRRGCEILGYRQDEIVGKDWFEHFLPRPWRRDVKAIFEALVEGKTEQFEYVDCPVLYADGQERFIRWHNTVLCDEHGAVVGTLSSGEDLTSRIQVREALEESQARAQAILESSLDAIITIDEQGRIDSFNPVAEQIFGYRAKEVVGQNVKVLMPQPFRDEHDGYLHNYRMTGRKKVIGLGREAVAQRKDGTVFPIDLSVSEVLFDGQRIFIGLVRDISDRRRLEREVLNISEQERQRIGRDLHDGLGSFLTGVAMGTQGLAQALQEGRPVRPEDLEELARMIIEGASQAQSLAQGLNPVKLETDGLPAALQELVARMMHRVPASASFYYDESLRALPRVVSVQLYRIAQEAINNAVKHARARHLWVRLATEEGKLRLTIRDDGVGLPDNRKTLEEGTGLHIMPYRANLIGATFSISRLPEGGTLVCCCVPLEKTTKTT
jgi:PAS domain S-box-containing protein